MDLIQSSIGTGIARMVGAIAVVLQGAILLRFLGPEQQGIYTLAILIPLLFFQFGNFSLEVPLISYLKMKKYRPPAFVPSLTLFGLSLGIIAYVLLLISLFFPPLLVHFRIAPEYFLLTMAVLPALLITYYYKSIMRSALQIKQFNIVDIAPKLFFLALLIILAVTYRLTVIEAIGIWITSSIFALFLCIYFISKNEMKYRKISFNALFKLIWDGIKIHIGAVSAILIARIDLVIINYYLSPADVGLYFIAITLAELIWFISSAVELTLHPLISSVANESYAVQKTIFVCRHVFYWSIFAAIAIGLFSKLLINIYGGQEYLAATTALLILLPGRAVYVIPKIITALWIRRQYFKMLTVISLSTAIINVIFNIILIPQYKIAGAAISASITYLLVFLSAMIMYYALVDKKIFVLFKIKYADLGIYVKLLKKLFLSLHFIK